jgi:hypothetical protein
MKGISKILILILITLLFSCDKSYFVDCNECFQTEGSVCNVDLLIGTNFGSSPDFEVTIYIGKIEDNAVIDSFTTYENTTFSALVNTEYSVKAVTTISGKTYTVINSVTPTTELVTDLCDTDCYIFKNNVADVRLKYF